MRKRRRKSSRRRSGRKRTFKLVKFGLFAGLLTLAVALAWPFLHFSYMSARLFLQPSPQHVLVPVKGVAASRIADTWGAPRSGGRQHRGIDIFAPRGTPVISTTDGVVVRRGNSHIGGYFVTIMGPGSYYHYYAHLQRPSELHPWRRIQAGAVVGFVGNTGNARTSPPHLHYGVYNLAGRPLNPYPMLAT
jgi:peptidoglycan LD-endopeptidase LytH